MEQKVYQTRLILRHDLTINWDNAAFFKGLAGEVIIYDDRYVIEDDNGNTRRVPGIKICDGVNYLKDLPFIDYVTETVLHDHITNETMHMSAQEHIQITQHENQLMWHKLGEQNEEEAGNQKNISSISIHAVNYYNDICNDCYVHYAGFNSTTYPNNRHCRADFSVRYILCKGL